MLPRTAPAPSLQARSSKAQAGLHSAPARPAVRVFAVPENHVTPTAPTPAPAAARPSSSNAMLGSLQHTVQHASGLLLPPAASHAPRRPQMAASAVSHPVAATTTQLPQPHAPAAPAPTKGSRVPVSQQPTFSLPPANVIILPNGQRAHSLHDEGLRVIESMQGWAEKTLLPFLKPVERSWQPSDFLPVPESPEFYDQVTALRTSGQNLPSDYMVALVGDMVTEEALPSYMNMLNLLDGTKDETGAQDQPWAIWTRHWTAEENRHGDLLNKYLYLSGRVNMKSIEVTIQRLIGNGLDPELENNPYLCFVYTSFQERATKISHANTARLAAYYGDSQLAKICGVIAADEGRHEQAYTAIVDELFKRDPNGAMLAFGDMMRKGIVMPAHLLDDGVHSTNNKNGNLFNDYAAVADNIGVYTTNDYAEIVEHLVKRWRVAEMTGLSGEAAAAQDYLVGHAGRIRRLANIQAERRLRDRKRGKTREASFDWIRGRHVALQ